MSSEKGIESLGQVYEAVGQIGAACSIIRQIYERDQEEYRHYQSLCDELSHNADVRRLRQISCPEERLSQLDTLHLEDSRYIVAIMGLFPGDFTCRVAKILLSDFIRRQEEIDKDTAYRVYRLCGSNVYEELQRKANADQDDHHKFIVLSGHPELVDVVRLLPEEPRQSIIDRWRHNEERDAAEAKEPQGYQICLYDGTRLLNVWSDFLLHVTAETFVTHRRVSYAVFLRYHPEIFAIRFNLPFFDDMDGHALTDEEKLADYRFKDPEDNRYVVTARDMDVVTRFCAERYGELAKQEETTRFGYPLSLLRTQIRELIDTHELQVMGCWGPVRIKN